MYICICIYLHIHIYTYTFTFTYTHIYIHYLCRSNDQVFRCQVQGIHTNHEMPSDQKQERPKHIHATSFTTPNILEPEGPKLSQTASRIEFQGCLT